MRLPQGNQAIITKEKLLDYILSETHSTGRFKAKFFRSIGFNETNVRLLEKILIKIAKSEEIENFSVSEYGVKYVLESDIDSPIGKIVKIRTIWIIEKGQTKPRFITIYPI